MKNWCPLLPKCPEKKGDSFVVSQNHFQNGNETCAHSAAPCIRVVGGGTKGDSHGPSLVGDGHSLSHFITPRGQTMFFPHFLTPI